VQGSLSVKVYFAGLQNNLKVKTVSMLSMKTVTQKKTSMLLLLKKKENTRHIPDVASYLSDQWRRNIDGNLMCVVKFLEMV
jgi:hypothetical protein